MLLFKDKTITNFQLVSVYVATNLVKEEKVAFELQAKSGKFSILENIQQTLIILRKQIP